MIFNYIENKGVKYKLSGEYIYICRGGVAGLCWLNQQNMMEKSWCVGTFPEKQTHPYLLYSFKNYTEEIIYV